MTNKITEFQDSSGILRRDKYIEPNADIRTVAATAKQYYNAMVEVGFSEYESFLLTKDFLQATISNGVKNN